MDTSLFSYHLILYFACVSWSVMMGYYLGSHLPVRELLQGIKGSYCPDNILLGDQYSALALGLVKREMETCPDHPQERFITNNKITQTHLSAVNCSYYQDS